MKTIKDAYEALNGDLNNTFMPSATANDKFLFFRDGNVGYILDSDIDDGGGKYQYICTAEEFNNYKPEKTAPSEFTQEFRLISGRGETWHKCKVVFKGKRYTVVENENGKEFSRRTAKLVIRDVKPTKTDKEKAIDGILCTMGCKGADSDSIYYKMAYRIYDAGYTKPLTVEGKQ